MRRTHAHTFGRRERAARLASSALEHGGATRACRGCGEHFHPTLANQAHCRPSCRGLSDARGRAAIGAALDFDAVDGRRP